MAGRPAAARLALLCLLTVSNGGNVYQSHNGTDAGWGTFISETMQHCYARLYSDSWCCLDQERAGSAAATTVQRANASWSCTEQNGCLDYQWGGGGPRGEDTLWTPSGASCSSPRILYIHGGSWLYGSPTSNGYPSLASKIAARSEALVLVIDYPLVPIGNYSAIMHWSLRAFEWLAAHGPLGAACPPQPPPVLLLGGDSAGGGTAASLALRLQAERDRWPPLAGVFLFSPWTNLVSDTPTYYYNSFARRPLGAGGSGLQAYTGDIIFPGTPVQNSRIYRDVAVGYVARDEAMLTDPVASPFFAGEAEFGEASAPVYVVVSETELIAGDSVVFATKASRHGVEAHLEMFPGMWHDFPMYSEGCGTGRPLWQAQLALNRTAEFVQAAAQRALAARAGHAGAAPCSETDGAPPLRVSVHYGEPMARGEPWLEVLPLRLPAPPCAAADRFAPAPGVPSPAGRPHQGAGPPAGPGGTWRAFGTFASGATFGAAAVALVANGRFLSCGRGLRRRGHGLSLGALITAPAAGGPPGGAAVGRPSS